MQPANQQLISQSGSLWRGEYTPSMSRLLIVEDDDTIGLTLQSSLSVNGHDVVLCVTGRAALESAAKHPPQLVLLDLGLPDMDGLSVCRELRFLLPTAVIVVLTARVGQLDIVSGLESGADDYLTKPFSVLEVQARVRAHLRRSGVSSPSEQIADGAEATFGSLTVDHAARRVRVAGNEVTLRAREYDLLARFVQAPGVAIRREDLMADVWDSNWFGSTKTLDVHVASLRRRLREVAETAGRDAVRRLPEIVTLRGHGYRMDVAADAS
jgi:DNA-binding response OmpR family regulator